jgi:hypothetical protein
MCEGCGVRDENCGYSIRWSGRAWSWLCDRCRAVSDSKMTVAALGACGMCGCTPGANPLCEGCRAHLCKAADDRNVDGY